MYEQSAAGRGRVADVRWRQPGPIPLQLAVLGSPGWVCGWEDYNGSASDTDLRLLLNPTYAQLGSYVRSAAVFKCPSDMSKNAGVAGTPRIRSLSMNQAIGFAQNNPPGPGYAGVWLPSQYGHYGGDSSAPLYSCYFKESDLGRPSPAGLFLVVEEHPDSINDPSFAFEMPTSPAGTKWIDMPAKYHANACNILLR